MDPHHQRTSGPVTLGFDLVILGEDILVFDVMVALRTRGLGRMVRYFDGIDHNLPVADDLSFVRSFGCAMSVPFSLPVQVHWASPADQSPLFGFPSCQWWPLSSRTVALSSLPS